MIKRFDKRGQGGMNLEMLIGGIMLVLLLAVVAYFIFQGRGVGDDVLNAVPSNLGILLTACEGISAGGEATQALLCGDFKDLGKVKTVERYGNCDYIGGQFAKETEDSIDCAGYNVAGAAKNFCESEELKTGDMINALTCTVTKGVCVCA